MVHSSSSPYKFNVSILFLFPLFISSYVCVHVYRRACHSKIWNGHAGGQFLLPRGTELEALGLAPVLSAISTALASTLEEDVGWLELDR